MSENLENYKNSYVADCIGDTYKQWMRRSVIRITAPTGSGKSYFILHVLLKYVIRNCIEGRKIVNTLAMNAPGVKIIYLVNRKILKKQLQEELKSQVSLELYKEFGKDINCSDFIMIETYQNIEYALRTGNSKIINIIKCMSTDPCYVVYDECHYFHADSNFNTYTELSYDFLRKTFLGHTEIFMSATMGSMIKMIKERVALSVKDFSPQNLQCIYIDRIYNPNRVVFDEISDGNIKERDEDGIIYRVPIDYHYIKLHFFESIDNLVHIVKKSCTQKEKWLIFTDQIEKGKDLKKRLIEKESSGDSAYAQEDVVCVDADYEKAEDANQTVMEISKKQMASPAVIITTAVMDNGISFHDAALRNLVIFADTEDEFIQMLGRKRMDGKKVDVFVCKRDKRYFARRKQQVETALNYSRNYKKDIDSMYYYTYTQKMNPVNNEQSIVEKLFEKHSGIERTSNGTMMQKFTPAEVAAGEHIVPINVLAQQRMLNDMLASQNVYDNIRKFTYFVKGAAAINSFSIDRLYKLQVFYEEMLGKMEQDEFAFVKQQAEWLGFSFDEVEEAICQSVEAMDAFHRKVLDDKIKELLAGNAEKILDKDANQDLKGKKGSENRPFFDAMKYFYKQCDVPGRKMKKSFENFEKTGSTIQPEEFNACMRQANLPYEMRKEKGNFIITKKEDAGNFEEENAQ